MWQLRDLSWAVHVWSTMVYKVAVTRKPPRDSRSTLRAAQRHCGLAVLVAVCRVSRHDRSQLVGSGPMQDDAVTAQSELAIDRGDTLLRAAGRARRQPVLWDQRCCMLQLFRRTDDIEASYATDNRIGQKPL